MPARKRTPRARVKKGTVIVLPPKGFRTMTTHVRRKHTNIKSLPVRVVPKVKAAAVVGRHHKHKHHHHKKKA